MKSKKMLIGVCIILVIIAGSLIWWNMPCSITNIAPSEGSKISIFDGNTGNSMTVTNATDIEHIIQNLNTVNLKKEKISMGYTGYSYRTTVYKVNGDVYKEFIINSSDTIRRDPFFYRDSSESIDYKFIQELFDKNIK
jgi:hypothetical protein